jgi:hypothetical protein
VRCCSERGGTGPSLTDGIIRFCCHRTCRFASRWRFFRDDASRNWFIYQSLVYCGSPLIHMSDMSNPSLVEEEDRHGDNHSQRSASRVNVDYFDPAGVQELRTTLGRLSNSGESNVTLFGHGPFDFEKTLKTLLTRCVFHVIFRTLSSQRPQAK